MALGNNIYRTLEQPQLTFQPNPQLILLSYPVPFICPLFTLVYSPLSLFVYLLMLIHFAFERAFI
jgi:hypothetical protein